MKVKYDAEADILIFILQDDLPYDAISEQGGVIVSYKEVQETVSIEFLQQFAFKPATNKNIKPIAGLCPATLLVVGLINKCCKCF